MALSYARAGQVTVTTAGTAVQGPDVPGGQFLLKAAPANTNPIWIGDSTVSATVGLGLKAADAGVYVNVTNLKLLWFDATTNGEKVCWIRTK